jgi:hypothetical protein
MMYVQMYHTRCHKCSCYKCALSLSVHYYFLTAYCPPPYKSIRSMENIHQHLTSKGFQWREDKENEPEDTADDDASLCVISAHKSTYQKSTSYSIDGMFDPNITVERTVRSAAKFVTAEEEAKSRKQEIDALKKRHETASVAGALRVTGSTAEGASYERDSRGFEFDNESRSEITSTMSVGGTESPFEGVDSEGAGPRSPIVTPPLSIMTESVITESGRTTMQHTAHPTPCTPGLSSPRRVLSSVDPDLILRLNKLFTPQKRFTPGSSCTVSVASSPIRLRGGLFNMAFEEEESAAGGETGDSSQSEIGSCQTKALTAFTPSGTETPEIVELILIPSRSAIPTTISSLPPPPTVAAEPALVPVVFKGSQSKFLQV